MQKVLDTITPDYTFTIAGREVVNNIGDYMKDKIAKVSVSPWTDLFLPYSGKIRSETLSFASTLSQEMEEDIQNALSDPLSGLSKLITALETTFTITQTAASAQYIANTVSHEIPAFVSLGIFQPVLILALGETAPFRLSIAFDTFISASYLAWGKN